MAVWKRVPELGVFEDLFEACEAIGRVEWLEEKSHMSQVKITPLPGTEPFVKGKKNQFVVWYKDDEECAE